jgi:hypothetical protein
MAAWPSSLPATLNVDGVSEQRAPGVVRTSMDAGPDFVRRRFSAVPVRVEGELQLSKAQAATLDAFFSATLNQGAAAFTWTHPRTGATAALRFLSPPRYVAISHELYAVTLSLEVLP